MSTIESTTPDLGVPSTEGVAATEPAGTDLGTADLGGAEVVGGEGDASAPAAPSYLEVEQYGDYLVKAKVDGEVKEIPFKDALNGVMRQEAFTKRTQELAEERRRLQQADALVAELERNPAATIKQLTEVYDLDPAAGFNPVERSAEEQQLVQMQRQLAQQQQALVQQRLDTEIAQLRQQYGEFDVQAVARFAHENGIGHLPTAYKAMQYDQQVAAQAKEAESAARRQAAQAAGVAHDGTTTQKGTVSTGAKKISSVREAWMAAKASQ